MLPKQSTAKINPLVQQKSLVEHKTKKKSTFPETASFLFY